MAPRIVSLAHWHFVEPNSTEFININNIARQFCAQLAYKSGEFIVKAQIKLCEPLFFCWIAEFRIWNRDSSLDSLPVKSSLSYIWFFYLTFALILCLVYFKLSLLAHVSEVIDFALYATAATAHFLNYSIIVIDNTRAANMFHLNALLTNSFLYRLASYSSITGYIVFESIAMYNTLGNLDVLNIISWVSGEASPRIIVSYDTGSVGTLRLKSFVYLDNIIVYRWNFQNYSDKLIEVFNRLR